MALTDAQFTALKAKYGDKCPECGVDLRGRDPYGHALSHYPEIIEPYAAYDDARQKQEYLLKLAGR